MAEWKIENWNSRKVFTVATKVNVAAMVTAAAMVEREVKLSFKTTKHQEVGHKRGDKFHYPSVEGYPPAIDSGHLRSSIQNEVIVTASYVDGLVGDTFNLKYAPMLELGTSKMAPRPFLRPALKKLRRKISKIFKEANGD